MSYVIAMLAGFVGGTIFLLATDNWRVNMLVARGYDRAVEDILKYGYYYNPDGDRISTVVQIGGATDEQ